LSSPLFTHCCIRHLLTNSVRLHTWRSSPACWTGGTLGGGVGGLEGGYIG
jgi:hypothetical protein